MQAPAGRGDQFRAKRSEALDGCRAVSRPGSAGALSRFVARPLAAIRCFYRVLMAGTAEPLSCGLSGPLFASCPVALPVGGVDLVRVPRVSGVASK